jgi:(S)-2-hydroxyglutarate dehydrogenase
MQDFIIIGGGIVGLAVANRLLEVLPHRSLVLLEKEPELCAHQSGRNSGVIHSGIYYRPGSLKAKLCRDGSASMLDFCRRHDIPHEICGKLIVATEESELPRLEDLFQRGIENKIEVKKLSAEKIRDIEPHANSIAGIHVPSTAIVDFQQVGNALASIFKAAGGEIRTNCEVKAIQTKNELHRVQITNDNLEASFLVNCGGLHSDRIARQQGACPPAKIIPFRGEYYELKPEKRHFVNGLVYPVPDPDLPFLGVHCTRRIDASVHLGPNAVVAFAREGYSRRDINSSDLFETLRYPGFWQLMAKHVGTGAAEMLRAMSKSAFVKKVQHLLPEIEEDDIVPCRAGVRAQAVAPDGKMVDDFLILKSQNAVHVCNAPSPAATASLEIGRYVVDAIRELTR